MPRLPPTCFAYSNAPIQISIFIKKNLLSNISLMFEVENNILRQIFTMGNLKVLKLFLLVGVSLFCFNSEAQNSINWTEKQLMEPAQLADAITAKKDVPVIICVGPGAIIPNSINVGMVNNPEGLQKLRTQLQTMDKDAKIVIYCGCCPFEHCPDVRPAIDALKEMHFTNYYLLNLPHNIKTDWIAKGYPVTQS